MNSMLAAGRAQRGMTLIEILFSVAIVGVSAAGITGLVMLNNLAANRLFNKVDNLNQARQVIERLGKDVRMARNIGDLYGQNIQLHPGPPAVLGTEGTNQFPLMAPAGKNPHYSGGQTPPDGWPDYPWPVKPYTLSPTCLIVQVPVFDANGFPVKVAAGTGDPPAPVDQDNVDTLVYQVLPDPDRAGEYLMQIAGFPGNPSSLKIRSNPPQTLLKGIVGPRDATTGQLKVFQYLNRYDVTGTPQSTWTGHDISNITGVVLNLEVRRQEEGTASPATIGFKSEMYMRNNRLRD